MITSSFSYSEPTMQLPNLFVGKVSAMKARTIRIDLLARVEGEGGLYLKVKDGQLVDVMLKIFEVPRFFEAFLRGRDFAEAPDITSRICGICPIAYQMSAIHAMENAFGVKVEGQLRALRRIIYCGEWISSHALHVYMLHAPDFLGYADAIAMAKDHPGLVQRGLQLKKSGNEIVKLLGGREIHPVNLRVGGFYKLPSKASLVALAEKLKWARDAALETVRWASSFLSQRWSGTIFLSHCAIRMSIRSTKAGWCQVPVSTSAFATTTSTLPKSM